MKRSPEKSAPDQWARRPSPARVHCRVVADRTAMVGYQAKRVFGKLDGAHMKDCGTMIAMFILMVIIAALGTLAVK